MTNERQAIDELLTSAKADVLRLEGQRSEMVRRLGATREAVSLARGRLTARKVLDLALEDLQREINDRNIGSYSRMLTALAREVMESPVEIGLELNIERGLPSLDIFVKRGDRRADIFESCGGSVTNIVCFGLRVIATARSGMRQFIALDEPDCWLEPDKVPNFFRVMEMLAVEAGMQILVITHHNLTTLGSDVNVVELLGSPLDSGGLRVARRPGAKEWASIDQPGLRYIRLSGHSSFAEATIPLSPGLNVVTGANNIGKSRILRALRGIAYGESDDSDIRDGSSRAEVDIGLEGGGVLHWSRDQKRNPVTHWKLLDASNEVVSINGTHCDGGGRKVPDWVGRGLGIARADGLDIQLAHQKVPVFLLERPAPQRAVVLSIGGDAGILRDMISRSRDDRNQDAQTIKTGETELIQIQERLDRLISLDDISAEISQAEIMRVGLTSAEEKLALAERLVARMDDVSSELAMAEKLIVATENLPDDFDISKNLDSLRHADNLERALSRIDGEIHAADKLIVATEGLPENSPELPDILSAHKALVRLEAIDKEIAKADALILATNSLPDDEFKSQHISLFEDMCATLDRLETIDRQIAVAERECVEAEKNETAAAIDMANILAENGNICPMCGTHGIHGESLLSTN